MPFEACWSSEADLPTRLTVLPEVGSPVGPAGLAAVGFVQHAGSAGAAAPPVQHGAEAPVRGSGSVTGPG